MMILAGTRPDWSSDRAVDPRRAGPPDDSSDQPQERDEAPTKSAVEIAPRRPAD